MAQTNYTPISLYYSTTASAVPTAANLVPGELAINTNDGKLYYEDSSGVVQVLATKSTGSIGGSTTQVQFNNSGSLGGSSSFTWDGTTVTATKFAGALNGTVGATTASTGAFTTLSATGRATFAASGFGAISASTGTMQGQTLYGGVLAGNGSSYDVMICNRSGSEVLGVIANTQNLFAAGSLTGTSTISVGNATPSTSGAGITFPATQSASSDANTLDDYEEGTWTPTVTFGGGSTGITYSLQTGSYTKIGNIVRCSFDVRLSSKGSSTGNAKISLPFVSNGAGGGSIIYFTGNVSVTTLPNFGVDAAATGGFYFATAGATGVYADTQFTNTSIVIATIIFQV